MYSTISNVCLRDYLEKSKAKKGTLEELGEGEHHKDDANRFWLKLPRTNEEYPIGVSFSGTPVRYEEGMCHYLLVYSSGELEIAKTDVTGATILRPLTGVYQSLVELLGIEPAGRVPAKPRFLRASNH